MKSPIGQSSDGFSDNTSAEASSVLRVERGSPASRNGYSKDPPYLVKETVSLLELALARCRADRSTDGALKSSIQEILAEARTEITGLCATDAPDETSARSFSGSAGSFIRDRLLPFGNRGQNS